MALKQGVLASSTQRMLVVAGLAVILLAAPTVYFVFTFHPYGGNVPNIIVPGSNAASAGSQLGAGTAEESWKDQFTLEPNDHIFRKPQTIRATWNVTLEDRSPDGVKKMVYLINGQFPGPTIEARSGDELVVDVYNSIQNSNNHGIAIHWHGLSMKRANHMDGVVGLTQCAIGPSESFTYRFRIDESQSGTFWYHAHAGLQRADGLFGGIVVHKPASSARPGSDMSTYQYDAEKLLLVGDWYHRQADTVFDWYQDTSHFGNEPAPDSLLINGQGSFNCSMAVKAQPVVCQNVTRPSVRLPERDRIRLRVVNTGVSSGLTLSISQGSMQLVTVDGGSPVEDAPVASSLGVLYPGERMDLILDRSLQDTLSDQNQSKYSDKEPRITVALDREHMRIENPALTRIQSFPLLWKQTVPEVSGSRRSKHPIPASKLSLSDASGLPNWPGSDLSEKFIEKAVLYTAMQIRSSFYNRPVGIVNHSSWIIADSKAKPLLALDPKEWPHATKQPSSIQTLQVPWYKQSGNDKWIELVLNNMDDTGHPFHFHGNEFYILSVETATQSGGYNPFDPDAVDPVIPKNVRNPLRKDTVYIPPRGFAILQFPLDNDGLWLFHCHVLLHQSAGMGVVLHIGDIDPEYIWTFAGACHYKKGHNRPLYVTVEESTPPCQFSYCMYFSGCW